MSRHLTEFNRENSQAPRAVVSDDGRGSRCLIHRVRNTETKNIPQHLPTATYHVGARELQPCFSLNSQAHLLYTAVLWYFK